MLANRNHYWISPVLYLALCLAISGCQSIWQNEPDFGSSVTSSVQNQLVNPQAPLGNPKPTTGLDGPSAKATVDSYQRSFRTGTSPAGAVPGQTGVGQ
ncbi:pilus assembly protein [Polynucleobacter sp. MG-6-Vaara-E2]|jgi:type IV pilus biogenesis protein CpaD/CtpE|uniref:pilus assembly protein n=1 Tax=Polynucleobacter sp. MG-6-Vaara-E2 TaxID=2576932 RepID=UPI001BFD86A8|nr:pilus assembly protein [Polynucleobacter sp. MG-6-Vaara-E2]QWD96216.1 pilus assembly protein [Polynucleobacter sp. MG-6-Vaara-E2]